MVATLAEVMPKRVRTVGFSLAFSLAAAIFGGMTPMVCTFLVENTGNPSTLLSGLCSLRSVASSQACIYAAVLKQKNTDAIAEPAKISA